MSGRDNGIKPNASDYAWLRLPAFPSPRGLLPTLHLLQRPSAGSLRALNMRLAFVLEVQVYDH